MTASPHRHPQRTQRRILERLAVSAVAAAGADHAAVGWVSAGAVVSVGGTDLTALVLTEEQVRSGNGPVIDALVRRAPVEAVSLPGAFAGLPVVDLAAAHGVAAMAAHPVLVGGGAVGVVATYHARPGAPAPGISTVVSNAARVLTPQRVGLVEPSTVDLAAQQLACRWRVDAIQALVALRAYARQRGLPLEDLAAGVLDDGVTLEPLSGERAPQ